MSVLPNDRCLGQMITTVLSNKIVRYPQINGYEIPKHESQWGQDWFVDNYFFKSKTQGVFVDIGCHNPIDCNNTWYFENKLNWTGICFEPNPEYYDKLRTIRKVPCFQAACHDKLGMVDFLVAAADVLSGIQSEYHPLHIQRIETDNKIYAPDKKDKTLQVLAAPLQWFLDSLHINSIDFLSIDVEGGELSVLKGINWEKTHVSVIAVEDTQYPGVTEDLVEFLTNKGFEIVCRLGGDLIAVNKDDKLF